MEKMQKLAERITRFIATYAAVSPNWDGIDIDEKYTSPDAYQLLYCASCLSDGIIPSICFSEWGSGGYHPYSSKEGREEHDAIVKEIQQLINTEDGTNTANT